VPLQKSIIKI